MYIYSYSKSDISNKNKYRTTFTENSKRNVIENPEKKPLIILTTWRSFIQCSTTVQPMWYSNRFYIDLHAYSTHCTWDLR